MKRLAIYPGSFDPITAGHLNIIRRASALFDEVIVVVMTNYNKINNFSFDVEQRVDFIKRCTFNIPNVTVDSSSGLLAEYAAKVNAVAIVKGLRAVSDFENEFQQALINKKLNNSVDTVFLAADSEHMFLSSSMIKQVCCLGGDVSKFLPQEVADDIINLLRK